MNLVFINQDKPVTDSLTVAEVFGKEHKHVLRDIESLECSEEFSESNFGLSTYKNERGRTYPKYLITQDGFSFLVMGYTGKEAARFKEMYINEFNRMKQHLSVPQFNIPQSMGEALRLAADLSDKNIELNKRIEQDKPLVVFAESVQVSTTSILVRDMAKLLKQKGIETGETRFFQYLRDNGYLIKGGSDYNMPTQKSMNLGLFEVKTGTRNSSEGFKITRTPKVTGKGQVYFINHFMKPELKLVK